MKPSGPKSVALSTSDREVARARVHLLPMDTMKWIVSS